MSKRVALHRRHSRGLAVACAAPFSTVLSFTLFAAVASAFAQTGGTAAQATSCTGDNGGITLPSGFCATVFADNLGPVRHMVMAPNGALYANTWSGSNTWSGYHNAPPPHGHFLIALKDDKGNGKADLVQRFGVDVGQGSAGGTGIGFYNGALYVEQDDRIIRYTLPADSLVPTEPPQVVVSGLPLTGDHPMHPFIIDAQGKLYVDVGSATDSCQINNGTPNSPGHQPCTELKTRAGTWRYDANKTDQHFSPAERYVTGLRNGEGFAFDSSGRLFATQHGRDRLSEDQPAEELVLEHEGADFGWPECYYDRFQNKLVLAPEYGGDGGNAVGVCAEKTAPVAAFPAHWAPNDLLIYSGTAFPTAYQGGAFIAFHGSSHREHGGYNVVFQSLKDGEAAGDFVVFADGFAGLIKEPGQAAFRPTGLAQGSDGALYVSDDLHGRIWRVTYQGRKKAARQ